MKRTLDVMSSWMSSVVAGPAGLAVGSLGLRPAQPLTLFEFEACPHSRKVRQALSMLDLEALIKPCPKGGTRFRPEARARGGKEQFPFLLDGELALYEADEIIRHLYERYGDGRVPLALSLGPLTVATSALATAVRPRRGRQARPSRAPERPLELWSFEASPYCRIAREALCELELPYLLHNVGKGSPRRADFRARAGRVMVPFLVDPNTGRELFESGDIVRYLGATYGVGPGGSTRGQ